MAVPTATAFALPDGLTGGVSAVAINSKGHLFALQRNPTGKPQLFEFDENHKLVRAIGDDVIGHQNKAHGMAIDPEDNIWICDENGDTVMKLSSDGKLLMTIGVKGQRGDWDEARGQRLLWQPLALAFAPNGDILSAWAMRMRVPTTPINLQPTVAGRRAYCTSVMTADSLTNGLATRLDRDISVWSTESP
jgi:hypothetical protein